MRRLPGDGQVGGGDPLFGAGGGGEGGRLGDGDRGETADGVRDRRRALTDGPDQIGHRGAHALRVHVRLAGLAAQVDDSGDVVRDRALLATPAGRGGGAGVPLDADGDPLLAVRPEAVDGQQLTQLVR